MTTQTATFNVVTATPADLTEAPVFGRIATFTWPGMSYTKLSDIAATLGLTTTVPSTGLTVAVFRAVEGIASAFKSGNYRRFARRLKDNVTELVQEVIIPMEHGEVRGARETVARFVVTGGKYIIKPENNIGREWLEVEEGGVAFDKRVSFEKDFVPAGIVGQWADAVVLNDIGGAELDNRGHSFHVVAAHAPKFDKFMNAMVEASNGEEQVFVAKTVDNSPETLASLIRSMRSTLAKAIEKAQDDASKAVTKRGVNGAIRRLNEHKARLDKYAALFGNEGENMLVLINKAVDGILASEVIKEYGGLNA